MFCFDQLTKGCTHKKGQKCRVSNYNNNLRMIRLNNNQLEKLPFEDRWHIEGRFGLLEIIHI